jgi:hypothetical protein
MNRFFKYTTKQFEKFFRPIRVWRDRLPPSRAIVGQTVSFPYRWRFTLAILKNPFFLLIILLLMAWLIYLAWHGIQLLRIASVVAGLTRASSQEVQPAQAVDLLKRSSGHLTAIDKGLRPVYPVLDFISIIPGPGRYGGQVRPLVSFSARMAQAGELLAEPLAPILDQEQSNNNSLPQRLYQALVAGQENFVLANQHLESAGQLLQEIDADLIPDRFQPIFQLLRANFPLLKTSVQLLPLLPGLMGPNEPRAYLVLAQNREELRPTGGFISGIGTLSLRQGEIVEFEIGDSYSIDDFSKPYPAPPEPLQRLMLAGIWLARDANWSPDFPTAARQTQELYTLSTGEDTHGVLAFDQSAIAALLEALGPVALPDVAEPVTAQNVETFMLQAWAPEPTTGINEEWWLKRKEFMGLLGRAIMGKALQARDAQTLAALARQMLDLLRTGHLLVYLNDPQAQVLLEQAGLAHQLYTGPGDYLMLVDSNFGFNKVDAVIQRSLVYTLDFRNVKPGDLEQPLLASLLLRYTHPGSQAVECQHTATYGDGTYEGMRQRCYWNYWRVYRPAGNSLVASMTQPAPPDQLLSQQPWPGLVEQYPGEAGKQVYAGVIVLPPGQTQEIQLLFDLLPNMLRKEKDGSLVYSLFIQKQPGLDILPVQLQVLVPQGYQLETGANNWQPGSSGVWRLSLKLDRSQEITLKFTAAADLP